MQKRILIVDDDELICELLIRQLSHQTCMIDVAHRGEKALQLIKSIAYVAVITDLHLPDMEGVELIKKYMRVCPGLPLIVISGGMAGNEQLFSELGVYRFFTKPLDLKKLKITIADILRSFDLFYLGIHKE